MDLDTVMLNVKNLINDNINKLEFLIRISFIYNIKINCVKIYCGQKGEDI